MCVCLLQAFISTVCCQNSLNQLWLKGIQSHWALVGNYVFLSLRPSHYVKLIIWGSFIVFAAVSNTWSQKTMGIGNLVRQILNTRKLSCTCVQLTNNTFLHPVFLLSRSFVNSRKSYRIYANGNLHLASSEQWCWLGHLTRKIVLDMTYNVFGGALNPTLLLWVTARYRKGPLSQRSAIANDRYCHVMCRLKLLYPSIRVRTAPPVSVRIRTRVSVSFSLHILFCMCVSLW